MHTKELRLGCTFSDFRSTVWMQPSMRYAHPVPSVLVYGCGESNTVLRHEGCSWILPRTQMPPCSANWTPCSPARCQSCEGEPTSLQSTVGGRSGAHRGGVGGE